MIITLEVGRPGPPPYKKCLWEEGNQLRRCSAITRRKQGYIMPLCHQFFDQVIENNLCPAIVSGWDRYPRRSYLRNLHCLVSPDSLCEVMLWSLTIRSARKID